MTIKKILLLVLLVCISATSLTACNKSDNKNGFDTESTNSIEGSLLSSDSKAYEIIDDTAPAYESTLDIYFNSICGQDVEKLLKIIAPDEVIKYYSNNGRGDVLMHFCTNGVESTYNGLEYDLGENINISYKIMDEGKLDEDDIKYYEENFYRLDLDSKIKVECGYKLLLVLTIKGQNGIEENVEATPTVLKINGNWVIPQIGCWRFNILHSTMNQCW